MHRLLCIVVSMLFLAAPLHAAEGWPKAKGTDPRGLTRELKGKQAEAVMRLVGNLPWLPDGNSGAKKKYLYVVYTPTCEISQALYNSVGKLTEQVEIRWIPIDPSGSINSMYEQRNAETVRRAFKNAQVPPDGDAGKTANINTYTMAGISWLLISQALSPDGNLYFPTLIYGTAEKAYVTIGPVKDIKKLVAGIPASDQPATPEAITFGAVKPEIVPVTTDAKLINKGKDPIILRLAPDPNAIKIGALAPGSEWPLPANGVTRNGYVVYAVSSGGAPIFAEAPDFAQELLKKK